MTPFELASTITNFKKEVKISYYISVAYNLTVAIRGIWSDETIAVADRLDRIKWMNEAMHRILNRLNDIYHDRSLWTEDEVWQTLRATVAQNPAINGDVGGAMMSAFEQTMQQIRSSSGK